MQPSPRDVMQHCKGNCLRNLYFGTIGNAATENIADILDKLIQFVKADDKSREKSHKAYVKTSSSGQALGTKSAGTLQQCRHLGFIFLQFTETQNPGFQRCNFLGRKTGTTEV